MPAGKLDLTRKFAAASAVALLLLIVGTAPLVHALVPITGATQVVVSSSRVCTRSNAGAVACWGSNSFGVLGDGTTSSRVTAVQVDGLGSGVRSLATNSTHTCAVTNGGGVKCWGTNNYGALGDGSRTTRATPVDVSGVADVAAVATGYYHSCALTNAGGVNCWGRNNYGQLGDGTTTDRLTPVPVPGLTSGVVAIATGQYHSCAATASSVKCWGQNSSGQLGDGTTTQRTAPTDVSGLAAGTKQLGGGRAHTCALTAGGGVRCWGANGSRQLGDDTYMQSTTPVDVKGLSTGAAAFVAGPEHNCALIAAGGVKCWGSNSYGQLGDGTTSGVNKILVEPQGLSGGVLAVGAGEYRSCAVVSGGGVKCWGGSGDTPVGDGGDPYRPAPGDVTGLTSGVGFLGEGHSHACVLTGGVVKCWGSNGFGQIGADFSIPFAPTPLAVNGLGTGVRALYTASGAHHNCAAASDGKLKCWGYNYGGQLGNGTSESNSPTPVDVALPPNSVANAGVGSSHSCAAMLAGGAQCWGDNRRGQLGDGTTTSRPLPGPVTGLTGRIAAIVGGFEHTCALTQAGGVKCWGSNDFGQLGDGSRTQRALPVDVRGLEAGVVAINSGQYSTCALTSAGSVKCWGSNNYGQLGNGEQGLGKYASTPVDVIGLATGATAVSVGWGHTCAVAAGGGPVCWGWNASGQFGDGRYYGRANPGVAGGMAAGVKGIAAGFGYSCALTTGGGVKCWGTKVDGMLGNNTLPPAPPKVPTAMVRAVPDQLAVVQFNDGGPVYAGTPFTAVVEASAAAIAGGVQAPTTVALTLSSGTGPLGGTATCTIPTGGHLCTVPGLMLGTAQGGAVLAVHRVSGDALVDGASAPFSVYASPTAPNYQGLWWNPNESGWGINFAHQGDIAFATWFTYDQAGLPWWLIATLQKSGDGAFTGPVYTVVGPPWNSVPFDSSKVVETVVGSATATFASEASGTLAYTVNGKSQSKAIVPQEFPKRPTCTWSAQQDLAAATNYTDLWWNANEAGWGVNFSHQSDIIFATWFTYDAAGKPWWLIAQLSKTGAGTYAGTVSTVTGPPFDSVPFDSSKIVETVVGSATLVFANGNSANFAYTVSGVSQAKAITRQVFVPAGTVCQ